MSANVTSFQLKSKLRSLSRIINLDVLTFFAISAFSWWLMSHTFSCRDGIIFVKHRVWSDFGMHIPLIRSFSWGENFPPQYPYFAGPRINYHFLMYLLAGWLEKAGLNIALAFNLPSAIGFALLLWLIYLLARLIFCSRAAGWLAVILFLFNGSMSYYFFMQKCPWGENCLPLIIGARDFAQFGPWQGIVSAFWTLNIYINQRHLALGYAVALLFLWPLFRLSLLQKKTPAWQLTGLLVLALAAPLLHRATIPIALVFVVCWMCFYPKTLKTLVVFYVLLFACSVPGMLFYKSSAPVFSPGFLALQKSFRSWAYYWVMNMGFYLALFPVLFVWGKKPVRALLTGCVILFAVCNTFRLSTEMFNNHKLVNFFILVVQLVTAGFLVELWKRRGVSRALTPALILALTLSGIIDFFPILNDTTAEIRDKPRSDIVAWIDEETPPQAMFLSSEWFLSAPSLAGRKLFLGYTYFPWGMGYPAFEREKIVLQMLAPDTTQEALCALLTENRIDYALIVPYPGSWQKLDARESFLARNWVPIFTAADQTRVFSVRSHCGL